jgi:tRNA(adenine34) deaminase
MWSGDDIHFMRLAMEEAEAAEREGEVPIGAVLVMDGQVMGRGRNRPIASHDPSGHAEILALRSAGEYLHNYRFSGATLYVTLEPCLMCFGALLHARVNRVIYGASDPKVGVNRLIPHLHDTKLNHTLELQGGLLADECKAQLQAFFQSRRVKG